MLRRSLFTLNRKTLQLTLLWLFLTSLFLNAVYLFPLGYFSDDFYLLNKAKSGEELWDFHYAPLLNYLWQATASGYLNTFGWHALTLAFHGINTFLVYRLACAATNTKGLDPLPLLAALLFSLSPAGCEALAWICASGYVFTAFFVLSSLVLFLLYARDNNHSPYRLSIAFALLQSAGFLTWDWAIVLFPILFTFAIIVPYDVTPRRFALLFGPVSFCWMIGFIWRIFSPYQQIWQHNGLNEYLKFYLGSPLLGFLPNVSKPFFDSMYGILLLTALWAFFLWTAKKDRFARACLLAYMISITPWVVGGNPSSRYFYLSMAFLYLTAAAGLARVVSIRWRDFGIMFLAIATFFFSYKKLRLWEEASIQASHLQKEVGILKDALKQGQELIIVNLPSAYGPDLMPLLPQFWHGGMEAVHPGIHVVKTSDCTYSWYQEAVQPHLRETLTDKYPNGVFYEVLRKNSVNWRSYSIVPFES